VSGRSSERIGKARKGTGKRFSDDFLGFMDITLTDSDRGELEAFMQPGQVDLEGFLDTVLEDGYKLSVAGDYEHHSCIATLTGRSAQCENKGYALSGRGPNAHDALIVLWYKHTVKAHWGAWAGEADSVSGQLPLWR